MTPYGESPSLIPEVWTAGRSSRPRARIRLLCFPHAGGGASSFFSWPSELPPWIDAVPVQLPGRENRVMEPPIDDMPPLVSAARDGLREFLVAPFALFGHSLGALVAFELASTLAREGAPGPEMLIASGHRAPHLPMRRKPIHDKRDRGFVRALRKLGSIPSEVLDHDEMRELLLPTLRADFRCFERYRYRERPPLECPIVAMGGTGDPLVPSGDLDPWRDHTTASFTTRLFPGDHFYLGERRRDVLGAVARDVGTVVNGG
jgi:medium-chain acyl-[acyl-carrier-protein] hydrolase